MSIQKHILEHSMLGLPTQGNPTQGSANKNRYWAYQTFTVSDFDPSIMTLTLTTNENTTTPVALTDTIIDDSAEITAVNGTALYQGIPWFSQIINTVTNTGYTVTLDKGWSGSKTFRIWFLAYGITPEGAISAPKFVVKNAIEWLEAAYVNTAGDTMEGDLDMNGRKILYLGTPALDGDAVRLMDLNALSGDLTSDISFVSANLAGLSGEVAGLTHNGSFPDLQGGLNGDYYHSDQSINRTDSPEFADANITTLASDSWLANTAKSILDFLNKSWSYIKTVFTDDKDPSGFVTQTPFTMSWDNGTRTLSLTGTYDYYVSGRKLSKTNGSVQISSDAGLHFISLNSNGDLVDSITAWTFDMVQVAIIYWNSNISEGYVAWEAHQSNMKWSVHEWLHRYVGTRYKDGLAATGYVLNNNTSYTRLTFNLSDGNGADEDIYIYPTHATTPTNKFEQELRTDNAGDIIAKMPVWHYASGAHGNQWVLDAPRSDGVYWKWTSGGRLNYNNINTGAQVQVTTNGYYVAYFIFLTTSYLNPIQVVQGQRQDTTLTNSRNNATLNSLILPDDLRQESKLLYIAYIRTNTSYTGTGSYGYVRMEGFSDFRYSTQSGGAASAVTNHSSLSNLSYEDAGHTGFGRLDYESTTDPTPDNDDVDTASIGRIFRTGDMWINTTSRKHFKCVDSTTGNAVWHTIIVSNGITGGQTINGSTSASENLNLSSTTDPTKGQVVALDVFRTEKGVKKTITDITTAIVTLTVDHHIITVSSGTFTQNLPTPSSAFNGTEYVFKNLGSGVITLSGSIDGYLTSVDLYTGDSITLICNATTWIVLG